MLDSIVVSLATGSMYTTMASKVLHAFDAAENATLVVTDDPTLFPTNTVIIPYKPDGTHIWHAKRHAVQAGLERAYTVYYLDGDFVPFEGIPAPKLKRLAPGIDGFAPDSKLENLSFVSIGKLANDPERLTVLELASAHFKIDWRALPWWGDFMFYVSRDDSEAWRRFIQAWDEFAHLRSNWFVASDGVALAFAAAVCGWAPNRHLADLKPINCAFHHVRLGEHNPWRSPARAAVS